MPTLMERIVQWLNFFQGLAWLMALISAGLTIVLVLVWQDVVQPGLSHHVLYAKSVYAKSVYARSFVVQDSDGRQRAILGMDKADIGAGLQLFGPDGQTRIAEWDIPEEGAAATLQLFAKQKDEHGKPKPRAVLGIGLDDGVALKLYDIEGVKGAKGELKPAVDLAVTRDGAIVVGLGQLPDDKFKVMVTEDNKGGSGLSVSTGRSDSLSKL